VSKKPKVLIADDEDSVRLLLKEILSDEAYVIEARTGREAVDIATVNRPDVIFLDIRMPGIDGLTALRNIKKKLPNTPVIMLTAYGDAEHTITAMREGAFEYIEKPFNVEDILGIFRKAVEHKKSLSDVSEVSKDQWNHTEEPIIIGVSKAMKEVFKMIGKIANINVNILITGESGVGKTHIAKSIHMISNRADKPLKIINASTTTAEELKTEIPKVSGGTVIIKELEELPKDAQVELGKILESGTDSPDVRFIGISRQTPEQLEKSGLRQEILLRLGVVKIHIPPLRERREDIPELVKFFILRYSKEMNKPIKGITTRAMDVLKNYDYPGNVRELENIIAHAVAMCDGKVIDTPHLPPLVVNKSQLTVEDGGESPVIETPSPSGISSLKAVLKKVERETIIAILREVRGNKTEAAKRLGISRQALFKKLKEHGITDEEFLGAG